MHQTRRGVTQGNAIHLIVKGKKSRKRRWKRIRSMRDTFRQIDLRAWLLNILYEKRGKRKTPCVSGIQASLNLWHRPESEVVNGWRKRWKSLRRRQAMCTAGAVVKTRKAAEKTVVREGYSGGGRRGVESEKETQIHLGDVFIKALIDGESSQY